MSEEFSNYADPEGIDYGFECDLHHFHPKDTERVVNDFISQAVAKGLRKIRLVHGKGKSVKKKTSYKILENNPNVAGFENDGHNWGATVIVLKQTGLQDS